MRYNKLCYHKLIKDSRVIKPNFWILYLETLFQAFTARCTLYNLFATAGELLKVLLSTGANK